MSSLASRPRFRLAVAGILLTLLLAAVFTFGSLDVPFEPKNWRDALTLYAVSSVITAALLTKNEDRFPAFARRIRTTLQLPLARIQFPHKP